MANILTSLTLTLYEVFKVKEFILVEVSEWRDFANGKSTDKVLGQAYTVVTPKTFDKIRIKIPNSSPVITQEEITSSTQQIMVYFSGDVLKFYRSNNGDYLPTIKAEKIVINKIPKV